MAETAIEIAVPASSANLGPGFDALGMALTLHTRVGVTTAPVGVAPEPPAGARWADEHHPATIAFHRAGGTGRVWTAGGIPMGRGLGYSGAVRVGAAAAAIVQRDGEAALGTPRARQEILGLTAALEGHPDNVAASLLGGVVVAAGDHALRVPLAVVPAVVVWVPPFTTATDSSRRALPDTVSLADAAFNVGRAALLVAALASGDVDALRVASEDRLHQSHRLATIPASAEALDALVAAGAWGAWLSGAGPSVAGWCDPADADRIAAALPTEGSASVVAIDPGGARLVGG